MLVLHAAESGNDVSTCVVGGCSQYSQSVIILRTAFCVCGRGVARGDGDNELVNAEQAVVVVVVE
jgi:hypothetical protein